MNFPPVTVQGRDDFKPLALIAEDHLDTRALLKIVLEMKGCEVLESQEGRQAADIAKKVRPDIVVLNVPYQNPQSFAEVRQIRNNTLLDKTQVIITSTDSSSAFYEKVLESGCDEFLVKPYDTRKLESILERHLATPENDA